MNHLKIKKAPSPSTKEWKAAIKDFAKPNHKIATWQIINSIGLYATLWLIMYALIQTSYSWKWTAITPVAIIAGATLCRVFIIFHDCSHGSFFKSKKLNNFWGFISASLVFAPYQHWKWEHNMHHVNLGHLNRRGIGDAWTLTVNEYLEAPKWKRLAYRFVRNPITILLIAPTFIFIIAYRFPVPKAKLKDKLSVIWSNLAIGTLVLLLCLAFGWKNYLIITCIIMLIATTSGVWLFYVQHQFEDTYWETEENWNYYKAAIYGSSYYKLPKILQWFSGNIGFHHIHHLSSKIPNYNLEKCHNSNPMFSAVKTLTFFDSLKCINYRLWDPETMKLITFKQLAEQTNSNQSTH